jgi:hypothetical protein
LGAENVPFQALKRFSKEFAQGFLADDHAVKLSYAISRGDDLRDPCWNAQRLQEIGVQAPRRVSDTNCGPFGHSVIVTGGSSSVRAICLKLRPALRAQNKTGQRPSASKSLSFHWPQNLSFVDNLVIAQTEMQAKVAL